MRIGYARVSTPDQSLDMQIDALKKAGCERIYSEKASGRKKDRAELERLLEFIRAGDTLVVWKLDRLGRTMSQLCDLIGELDDRKVGFESLTEQIDTSTIQGTFLFHIAAAFAQMEADLTRERTKAGLAEARKKGHVGGHPRTKAEDVDRVAMAIEGGMTVREACKLVGISVTTYYNYKHKGTG